MVRSTRPGISRFRVRCFASPRNDVPSVALLLHALRNEGAVRLMKDHFIDGRPLAAKFNDEALQLDDAEPSSLLGREAIGRLVIGLQHKAVFAIERNTMRYRAALEVADASRAERGIDAVAGRKACKDDILH